MPCQAVQYQSRTPLTDDEHDFAIAYTQCPSWGRSRRVYLLDSGAEGGHLHFQSAADLPEDIQFRRNERNRIFPEHPVTKLSFDAASLSKMESFAEGLSLPLLLGEFIGGFDGTRHYLRIERAMTAVEFHWWEDLPERWLPLEKIISVLVNPFESSHDAGLRSADFKEM